MDLLEEVSNPVSIFFNYFMLAFNLGIQGKLVMWWLEELQRYDSICECKFMIIYYNIANFHFSY